MEAYSRFYDKEWERRAELQEAAGAPLTVLTLLGGTLWYMFSHVTFGEPVSAALFLVFSILGTCFYVQACWHVYHAYSGQVYKRLPLPSELKAYHKELLSRHVAVGNKAEAADRDFAAFLEESYIAAGDVNSQNNVEGGAQLFEANGALARAVALLAIGAIPFAINIRLTAGPLCDS